MLRFAIVLPLILAGMSPALAQSEEDVLDQIEQLHGQSEDFVEAYSLLQDAFLFDDPTQLVDMAAYPLEVAANGELYDVLAPEDLVDNFDSLVTQDTMAALGSQDFDDLIVTSDGVGFANGALWMALVCADDACESADWLITRITN